MKLSALAVAAVASVLATLVAACGGSGSSSPAVPSVSNAAATGAHATDRAAAVHAAAKCIRDHGIPNYQEPAVTATGQVFSDTRSIQDTTQAARDAIQTACATLLTNAGFNPTDEPPAPPALVRAGVKAAQCLRAHGLPNIKDPTAQTSFVPGHGFGVSADQMPAAGKADPAFQTATQACRTLLDAEIEASTLANLAQ